MSEKSTDVSGRSIPIFTLEDLELFKSIRSNLSPGGRNLVDLLLKVFDSQNSPTDLAGIIQNLGDSGTGAVNMLYAMYALMNNTYDSK